MGAVHIPTDVPEDGHTVVWEDADGKIIIADNPGYDGEILVELYVDHAATPTVIPDSAELCARYDEPTDPSSITDYPAEYESVFKGVVDQLIQNQGYRRVHEYGREYGVSATCECDRDDPLSHTITLTK